MGLSSEDKNVALLLQKPKIQFFANNGTYRNFVDSLP